MDRNKPYSVRDITGTSSLSARRAWIEIIILLGMFVLLAVALRKESVDRNNKLTGAAKTGSCRSPQGERG